jgi:hypothetical protein
VASSFGQAYILADLKTDKKHERLATKYFALVVCVVLPFTAPADSAGYKVTYDGGSPTARVGASLYLYIDSGLIRLAEQKGCRGDYTGSIRHRDQLWSRRSPPRRYGYRACSRKPWDLCPNALEQITKHFVGITWADGDKKGGFVMQCDKSDYRGILLGLKGVTGKKQ